MTHASRADQLRRRLAAHRGVPAPRPARPEIIPSTPDGSDPADRIAGAPNLAVAFDQVARRFPDRTAIRHGEQTLTYRELLGAVEELTARIRATDHPHRTIALLLPRSMDMIVAALAVIRTGAAYLPLDPEAPPARIGLVLDDAAPSLVITTSALTAPVPPHIPHLLTRDAQPGAASGGAALPDVDRSDRAYIIYTSGTTGRPKGVEVSHGNALRLFTVAQPLFGFTQYDTWSLFHSFAFDVSVWEMWGALLSGACVVVVDADVARDPVAFRRLLRDERVTMLSQTPTAFSSLVAQEDEYPDRLPLKWVVLAGEALRFGDLRPWFARYGDTAPDVVNMYGITETTVHSTYRRVTAADLDSPASLIGQPLPDLEILLWDEHDQPTPDGQIGQIVVTGAGVALGYLGRPELTAQRFVEVTDADGRTTRGYRSGDLARRTASGEYEYHGRADDQVKIRGYRVELGEVHAALLTVPGVRQAAVVPQTSPDTGTTLIAYVVSASTDDGGDPEQLRQALAAILPAYAIPAAFVRLDALPRTRNGKLDRTALPAPVAGPLAADSAAALDIPSAGSGGADGVESALIRALAGLLPAGFADPTANFFDQGGNSLLATRFLAAVRREHGVVITLRDFLKDPTIRAIAGIVRRQNIQPSTSTSGGRSSPRRVGLLSFGVPTPGATPLVAVPGVFGFAASMARLATHVADRPFHALQTRDLAGAVGDLSSAEPLIRACRDAVLPVLDGTVHLVGHSVGGCLALHLADALRAAGCQVESLILLDSPSPQQLAERTGGDLRSELVAFLRDVAEAFPEYTVRWREVAPDSLVDLDDAGVLSMAASLASAELTELLGGLPAAFDGYRAFGRIMSLPPPRPPVPALLLLAAGDQVPYRDQTPPGGRRHTDGWRQVLPDIIESAVDSSHEEMLREPGVGAVAALMADFLRQPARVGGAVR